MEASKYIVFLDLDGTLIADNSGYSLIRTAYNRKLIGFTGVVNAILLSLVYKLHLAPEQKIINSMGSWLKGMPIAVFQEVAGEAVQKYLINSVYEKAAEEIEFHRSKNAELAILSSAVEQICQPLAAYLGVHHIICTEMKEEAGLLTGNTESGYCYGIEKGRRLISFCEQNGFDRARAYYYADSFADLNALESVGNPVCVNPDKRLKRTALRESWQIRSWEIQALKK